jgi:hypothetical protein
VVSQHRHTASLTDALAAPEGSIATLDLRHFPLIKGVVVEDWSNVQRLFRVLVSEHDDRELLRF